MTNQVGRIFVEKKTAIIYTFFMILYENYQFKWTCEIPTLNPIQCLPTVAPVENKGIFYFLITEFDWQTDFFQITFLTFGGTNDSLIVATIPFKQDEFSRALDTLVRIYKDTLDQDLTKIVSVQSSTSTVKVLYSYLYDFDYRKGQSQFGYDQYATYWDIQQKLTQPIVIQGLNTINYYSVTVYYDSDLKILNFNEDDPEITYTLTGDEATPIPNPWQIKNPNSSCYGNLPSNANLFPLYNIIDKSSFVPLKGQVENQKIDVFRIDEETSQKIKGEKTVRGECSATYLYATQQLSPIQYMYGVMQITLPNCYVPSMCEPQENYDVQYFSVSSNQKADGGKRLPFWTVNYRMMKQYEQVIDNVSYAYVFFAPVEQIEPLLTTSNQSAPPVVSWGDRQGYIFAYCNFAFIFRYKDPKPSWPGSPINAPCYKTQASNLPITDQLTKDGINWCPQIYGDNFTSLQDMLDSPTIGPVQKDQPWPQ
jgi:hypothetical protein